MVPPPPSPANGELINGLAVKYRLPTIYSLEVLRCSRGIDFLGSAHRPIVPNGCDLLDRILRDAKINELPVHFPSKLEMAINLKTAKAIGLTLSRTYLAHADDLIE